MTKQSLWNRGLAALDEWLALARAAGDLPRGVAVAASLEPPLETQIEQRNVLNFVRWRNRLQAYRGGFPPQPKNSARADCAALGVDIRTLEMRVAWGNILWRRWAYQNSLRTEV